MVRAIDRECLSGHARGRPIRHGDRADGHGPLGGAVAVVVAVALLHHRFRVLVDGVYAARGVHPADVFVEALVDEELPPRHRPVGIQPFLAHHLHFGTEKERRVRVDEEQRVVVHGVRRRDGDTVRARRVRVGVVPLPRADRRGGGIAVDRLEVPRVDVAADAPFAERERHPRLKAHEDAGLHVGMLGEVEVQAVGPGVHQALQPLGARRVLRFHGVGVDEQLHPEVLVDRGLALRLRQPSHRVQVVGLDPIEVVLGLRVHEAEDGVGVRPAVHVRDAPIIPDDRDVPGLLLPAGDVLGQRDGESGDNQQRESLHAISLAGAAGGV